MNKLVTYLINHNIKSRKDCNFAVSTIRKILTNPVYCIADLDGYKYFSDNNCNVCCTPEDCTGEYGFVGYSKTQQDSKERIQSDLSKWIISVGKHTGIITGKDYVEVQKILLTNINYKVKFKQSHNPVALLSGILMCKCGSYMRPKYYHMNKDNIKPFAYMCELKEISKKNKCDCGNLNGLYADKMICDMLLDFEADDNIFHKYLDNIKTDVNNSTSNLIKEREILKSNKQQEIKNLINVLGKGLDTITLEYINQSIVTLNDDIKKIDVEIETLKATQQMNDVAENNFKNTLNTLIFFKDNFNKMSIENKRNYIRKCIAKIIWDGNDLHIFTRD